MVSSKINSSKVIGSDLVRSKVVFEMHMYAYTSNRVQHRAFSMCVCVCVCVCKVVTKSVVKQSGQQVYECVRRSNVDTQQRSNGAK